MWKRHGTSVSQRSKSIWNLQPYGVGRKQQGRLPGQLHEQQPQEGCEQQMLGSEDRRKGLSSKGGSMGEVRSADRKGRWCRTVVLWDPNRRGLDRFINNRRMRQEVGLLDRKVGARLKIMSCNSSTLIYWLSARKGWWMRVLKWTFLCLRRKPTSEH